MSKAPLRILATLAASTLALAQTETQPTRRARQPRAPDGLTEGDWSRLRSAHEAGRFAAYSVGGAYIAENPGQSWRTRFDGRGFLTEPDAGDWTWGLELARYGFAGSERDVTGRARLNVEGGRVAYTWDTTLEEWYDNDGRGLEHGYRVHHRPPRDGEHGERPLAFTLAVRGELRPEVAADRRGVRFLDDSGAVVLTYTGLRATDADGEDLEAGFELAGSDLLLTVDERGARYPVVIDPIAQQAYLKASNAEGGDVFGWSVALSGDTLVVGSRLEDSGATGVDGDQGDNSVTFAGAAYVFVRLRRGGR